MYSCSEDLIIFHENDETFEFTIILYDLTFSTKKIEVKDFWFNICLYENFIITNWDVICIDDPLQQYRLNLILKSDDDIEDIKDYFNCYKIQKKGSRTKAAARAEMD